MDVLAQASAFTELPWQGWLTLALLVVVLTTIITERLTADFALTAGLAILLLCGVVQPEAGLAGYSNPAVLTLASLFIIAAAVRKSGALSFLEQIIRPRGKSVRPALLRVMLPASLMSSFLNNTPIVAFLTPMVQQWARRAGISPSKLLMPLSFATILGGMGTLVGSSTNLLISSALQLEGYEPFSMFELLWIGLPASVLGCAYFVLWGHKMLSKAEIRDEKDPGVRRYQFDLLVPDDSPLVGRTIETAGLRHLEDAYLAHIFRRAQVIGPVAPDQALEAGDILTFSGKTMVMDRLLRDGSLIKAVAHPDLGGVASMSLPTFEAVVSPGSSLVGKTLKDSDFRERFQAVVLGIHRGGKRFDGPVGLSPVEGGDLLLIEARPKFDERWAQRGEFYFVAPTERLGPHSPRDALWVLGVLIAMIVVVATGVLPIVTASLAAAMLLVLGGRLTPSEARGSVDLSVLIVIASAFGIGQCIGATGLDRCLGQSILGLSGGVSPIAALAIVYIACNLLTEVLTNAVAAILVFPIGLAVADACGADPRAFAVAVATAASASFATPIGYQTNLMVMGPGGYRFVDYIKAGLPLNVLVFVLAIWIIPIVWM